ncbi:hypothetical protein D8I35_02070 [Corticibacter populi]|uniref:Uncharacterized protein n=1 Tax=Corticibacter populi TaxID=1550736 RepID=A0A3M6QY60_9BURK|nr:hypothetical protein [Corticibacter populi]RMX07934.1 hypothetical protein D8I35_02070 [Corticibacter populi]
MAATSACPRLARRLQAVFWALAALALVAGLAAGVAFLFERQGGAAWEQLVLIGATMFVMWAAVTIVQPMRQALARRCCGIVVDASGIHYQYSNGDTEALLYQDLVRTYEGFHDVRTQTIHRGPTLLTVCLPSKDGGRPEFRVVEFGLDFQITTNRLELLGHFIRGIQTFRPDLRVSSQVFSAFFIDEHSYLPQRKKILQVYLAAIAVVLFVTALVYLHVFHGGESP